MSFSGFSEDDIRMLTKKQDVNKTQKGPNKLKKVTFKPNHLTNTSRPRNASSSSAVNNLHQVELPEDAKLSLPNIDINNRSGDKELGLSPQDTAEENINGKEDKLQVIPHEKKFKDLDEFEARQKLIEEQNRKRKELLAKALADRTKQTQEEAQRLHDIQEEFRKLDAILSNDVKILRKQIEAASFEYMESQKRYDKIEKEFLDAKVVLHQKLEKKELLTEHLCTIIEKNEERKADKLNELLLKLQINPPMEDAKVENKDDSIKQ